MIMSIWLDNIHGSFSWECFKHLAFKELYQKKQKDNFEEHYPTFLWKTLLLQHYLQSTAEETREESTPTVLL